MIIFHIYSARNPQVPELIVNSKQMYLSRTPAIVKAMYGSLIWNHSRRSKNVYLTFDDGPHPIITDKVLTHLKNYNALATFFCVGENVMKYPEVLKRIQQSGHAIGNHSFKHLNGWKTKNEIYFNDIELCSKHIPTKLFRPPYGKITRSQVEFLKNKFQIVMWDVLSGDFDQNISNEKCLNNVVKNIQPGSIVVFHDSEKTADKMLYALPKTLEFCKSKSWNLCSL